MRKKTAIALTLMAFAVATATAQQVRAYPFSVKLPSPIYAISGEGSGLAFGCSAGFEYIHNNIGYSIDINYNDNFFYSSRYWAIEPSVRRYLDQRLRYFVGCGAGAIFGHYVSINDGFWAGNIYAETGIRFPLLRRSNRVNIGFELALRDKLAVLGQISPSHYNDNAIYNSNYGVDLLTKIIVMF